MSNLKKIFFAVIITILVILGYSSISNAAYRLNEYKSKYGDYYIGQHKTEGYQQYLGQKALFCLEHGQRLRSQTITYTVKSIITLKGDTATGPVQDGTYKNGDIKLVGLSEHVKNIFEMVGLDELFEMYEDENKAIVSF